MFVSFAAKATEREQAEARHCLQPSSAPPFSFSEMLCRVVSQTVPVLFGSGWYQPGPCLNRVVNDSCFLDFRRPLVATSERRYGRAPFFPQLEDASCES